MSEVTVEFFMPAEPLNMNDRVSPIPRSKQVKLWREAAYWATCAAFEHTGPSGRRMPPSTVYVSIPVVGTRRRDPSNWMPTVKPIIDGMTDAGMWPDDDSDWVTIAEPSLRVVDNEPFRNMVYVRVVPR